MRALITAVAVGVALLLPATAGAWSWPSGGALLRAFSMGSDPYAAGQRRGIDVGGALGERVLAPASGTVSFVGRVPGSGLVVTIQTTDGYAVTLTHLGSAATTKG